VEMYKEQRNRPALFFIEIRDIEIGKTAMMI
jgi:hypothetical protein